VSDNYYAVKSGVGLRQAIAKLLLNIHCVRHGVVSRQKVKSMVDLGVRFDSNLTFRDHISEKINKAYSVLGIIKRNFIYMDEHTFILGLLYNYARMLNLQIRFGARIR